MPLPVPFISLLADAAPLASDPSSYTSTGWLLAALAGLAVSVNQLLGVFEKLRTIKRPDPGSVSLDRVKALEDRGKALEERMHGVELKMENHLGSINAQFSSISQTLTNLQSDWNYAIGKIDGRSEAQADR